MFDLSFSELLLIAIVAIVVVGPRRLPGMLRNAGHIIGRLRRMATDLRTESGIDDILDAEGLRNELDNFRRLAAGQISLEDLSPNVVPEREREYPRMGCDSYSATSEDLVPYLPAAPAVPLLEAPALAVPAGVVPSGAVPIGAVPAGVVAAAAPAAQALSSGEAVTPISPSAPAVETAKAPLSPSNGAGAKN
ncbi:MAG TPA: Sec-independent protein translocase protein TatB [Polyangiaceae bacterium]